MSQKNIEKMVIKDSTLIKYEGSESEVEIPESVTTISPFAFYGCNKLKKVTTPVGLTKIGKAAFDGCYNLCEVTMPGRLYRQLNKDDVFPVGQKIYFRFYASSYSDNLPGDENKNAEKADTSLNEEKEVKNNNVVANTANVAEVQEVKQIAEIKDVKEEKDGEENNSVVLQPIHNTVIQPVQNTINIVTEEPPVVEQRVVTKHIDTTIERTVEKKIVPVEVVNRVVVVVTEEEAASDEVNSASEGEVKVYRGVNVDGTYNSTSASNDNSSNNAATDTTETTNITETLKEKISSVTPVEVVKDLEPPIIKHDYKDYEDFIVNDGVLVKYVGTKQQVVVPDFITEIGENAFSNSNVTQVSLPEGINKISGASFAWCEKLQKITLPKSLLIIDDNAFADCSNLEEIEIPYGVRFIGASAFHACCALKQIMLPPSLTSIGRRAFDFCVALEEVRIPSEIKVLSDGIFSHCEGLKRVYLPNNLTTISDWAFADCYALEEINLPENLHTIGEVAFLNCKSLIALAIPHSVAEVGRQAYCGCSGLSAVFIPTRLENKIISSKVFKGLKNLQIHYVDLM